MKKISALILSLSLFTNLAVASPVTYLSKDTPAPYTGYLFTPDAELNARAKIQNYDRVIELNMKQDELITILNKRISVKDAINTELQDQVSSSENTKWIYFGLGIIVTGLVAYKLK